MKTALAPNLFPVCGASRSGVQPRSRPTRVVEGMSKERYVLCGCGSPKFWPTPIWADGFLAGHEVRKSLGTRDWEKRRKQFASGKPRERRTRIPADGILQSHRLATNFSLTPRRAICTTARSTNTACSLPSKNVLRNTRLAFSKGVRHLDASQVPTYGVRPARPNLRLHRNPASERFVVTQGLIPSWTT
jgi:hypothetical protein